MNKFMNRTKEDNKGFSLIELIIVIAIMAILVGIIALQVIPYMEKSRVGKDKQTVDTVYQSFQSAIADEALAHDLEITITQTTASATTSSGDTTTDGNILASMATTLGATGANDLGTTCSAKLASKGLKNGSIVCKYTEASKKIEVYGVDSTGAEPTDATAQAKSSNK